MNNVSKRILAFALAVATVIAFTPAIAFTQRRRKVKVTTSTRLKIETTCGCY